jgi:glutathione synthase/RimK-type ligase-like ATP-grasp enzyme
VIVAVTHQGDEHLAPVRAALARRGEVVEVVDLAEVPGRWRLALPEEARRWTLRGPGRRRIRPGQVTAVWWRRLKPLQVSPRLSPGDAAFARLQYQQALAAFWDELPARKVNDPRADERAGHKPAQLAAARRAGLAVPPTLITDDPALARTFLRRVGPAIHKPLLALQADHLTRLVDRAARRDLEAVRLAPVIFQAFVPGVDVRVTAVGRQLFACAIDARATASPQDFRPVLDDARVARCAVPPRIAAGIRALMTDLGLVYGALDFRRRADGSWFFLEVNPAGQWLGFEERTGLPITEAVAALLAGAR